MQWLVLAAVVPFMPAHADSDGYLCVGPGFVVLESRFDGDGQHRLFIYWLNDGIGPKTQVLLPDFQTHDLECRAGMVRVRGWDEAHEVDVSQSDRPRYVGKVSSPRADAIDVAATARQISKWPSGRLDLGEPPGGAFYELRVSNSAERYPGSIETTTVAKLLRLSPDGALLDSRVIYAGTSIETID